jgi:hypothetical protein
MRREESEDDQASYIVHGELSLLKTPKAGENLAIYLAWP